MLTNQIYKQPERKNNMAKVIGVLIIGIFIALIALASVSAASITVSRLTYDYKVGSQIDIKNPCYYNGANCPPTTTCAITVYDPNNAIIINNQQMTYSTAFFNYTLPDANYSIGSYKCDMVCTYAGVSGSQRFYLDIGSGGNMGLFLILALASLLLLLVGYLMENEYIGFISSTLFILTGLYALIYGVGNLSNLYTTGIGWVALGLGILFMMASAYSAIANGGFFKRDGGFEDSLDSDNWGSSGTWG